MERTERRTRTGQPIQQERDTDQLPQQPTVAGLAFYHMRYYKSFETDTLLSPEGKQPHIPGHLDALIQITLKKLGDEKGAPMNLVSVSYVKMIEYDQHGEYIYIIGTVIAEPMSTPEQGPSRKLTR